LGDDDDDDDDDNNFEEIEIVDTDAVIDNDTEIENEKINKNDGIFCKNKDDTSEESSDDDNLSTTVQDENEWVEVDLTDIESLNSKSKLIKIQEVAKNHSINIASGQTKTGKIKMKTRKQLVDELNSILKLALED
jgi:hypothetical protein